MLVYFLVNGDCGLSCRVTKICEEKNCKFFDFIIYPLCFWLIIPIGIVIFLVYSAIHSARLLKRLS
jgi:hypothetical protein